MNINLDDMLPDGVSDEVAYCLVEFFSSLALAIESHYFSQARRHMNAITPPTISNCALDEVDEENHF